MDLVITSTPKMARTPGESMSGTRTRSGRGPSAHSTGRRSLRPQDFATDATPTRNGGGVELIGGVSRDQLNFEQMLSELLGGDSAWNSNLIDYFDLYTFQDDDGAIDYRKAARYLSGAVRVQRQRVEELRRATQRLATAVGFDGTGEEEGAAEGSGGPATEGAQSKRSKSRKRKDVLLPQSKLIVTEDDFVSSSDPLVNKQQVQFGRRGVCSMMLFSLTPDKYGRVSFEDQKLAGSESSTSMGDEEYLDFSLDDFSLNYSRFRAATAGPALKTIRKYIKGREQVGLDSPAVDEDEAMEPVQDSGLDNDGMGEPEMPEFDFDQDAGSYEIVAADDMLPDPYADVGLDQDMDRSMYDLFDPAVARETSLRLARRIDAKTINNAVAELSQRSKWKFNQLRRRDQLAAAEAAEADFASQKPAESASASASASTNTGNSHKKRVLQIDFGQVVNPKDVLQAPSRDAALQLTNQALGEKRSLEMYLVDSRDFTRFYLKPEDASKHMRAAVMARRGEAVLPVGDISDDRVSTEETGQHELTRQQMDDMGDDMAAYDEQEHEQAAHHEHPAADDELPRLVMRRKVDQKMFKTRIVESIEELAQPELMLSQVIEETAEKYSPADRSSLVGQSFFLSMLFLANEEGYDLHSVDGFKDVAIAAR